MRLLHDLKKYWPYTLYAARAQLKAEVSGSYLNWLWWVLEPLCMMFIYLIVFGSIFKLSERYFPIFIFSSNAMWAFFSSTMSRSTGIMKANEPIISRAYVPKPFFLLTDMLCSGFKMLLSFGIVVLMLAAFRVEISWRIVLLPIIFFTLFLFTFGAGLFCLHLGVYIEDLSYVVSLALRMMTYLTGIFYSVEDRVPAPWGRILSVCNPMAFLLSAMRKTLIYAELPDLRILAVWTVLSLLLCAAGLRLVYGREGKYVKVM